LHYCKAIIKKNFKLAVNHLMSLPKSPILLNGMPFEKVELFKHLGLVISSDLSWSNHITSISAKAKRILDLLYRQYYNHVEGARPQTKLLYLSCQTTPGIQLCTLKDKRHLELVQKFACKMASKHCLGCWIRGSTGASGFTIQNYPWPVSIPHWDFYSWANSSQP